MIYTASDSTAERVVDLVDPLLDSAHSRWIYFSSACRPFGMVNLSPDTVPTGDWGGGYRYDTPFVHGLSHIHAWQLGGLLVLPTAAGVTPAQGSARFGSPIDHSRETAHAGYHALHLDKYSIDIEMTATPRVGIHRYTFTESDNQIIIDLASTLGPCDMGQAQITQHSPTRLSGFVVNQPTLRRPRPCTIHFAITLDQPTQAMRGWLDQTELGNQSIVTGESGVRVALRLDAAASKTVQMKVALSYTSEAAAWANMQAEAPGWDFASFRKEASDDWNDQLGRIRVEGGRDQDRRRFYTDLWHALLGRRTVSDVTGSYIDNTGPDPIVRQIPCDKQGRPRYRHFNSDSFWGAQWSITPLWLLAWPELVDEFCHCFLDYYRNGGLIPRGPSGGNYTFVMSSAQTTPLFAAAIHSKVATFDRQLAYEGLRKNHLPGGLMSKAGYEHTSSQGGGIEYYIERGYIPEGLTPPCGFPPNGASQTLENAYNDWALSELAKTLGHDQDAATFAQRARHYRNLFDTSTGFMRPRQLDGQWLPNFDPMAPADWCEGNAWQYTWYAPHDVLGLIDLFGSADAYTDKLNEAFAQSQSQQFCAPHEDCAALPINYGNQPSTYQAHLFIHAGKPWLSQYWVRQVLKAKSGDGPYEGYRGDEDQGMMGAVNALMAMGLFSVTGAASTLPTYELTAPLFDRVTIDRPGGVPMVIEAHHQHPDACYIHEATLNGQPHHHAWLTWDQIAHGGHLRLKLQTQPHTHWGVATHTTHPAELSMSVKRREAISKNVPEPQAEGY